MKIDFNLNKFQNTFNSLQTKTPKISIDKITSASSIDALASYNKFLTFRTKPKTIEFKDLSDEEFEKYKTKVQEKIDKLNAEFKYMYISFKNIDKLNIFLIDTLISNPIFYKNDLMRHKGKMVDNIQSPEIAKARLDFLNKIISDEKLSYNWDLLAQLSEIAINAQDEDNLNYMNSFLDKYVSDEKLYNNYSLQSSLGLILKSLNRYSNKLLDTIIQNDKLFSNKSLMLHIHSNIANMNSDTLKAKISFIERFLSDPKLNENAHIQNQLGHLLMLIENIYQFNVINRILSDDKFLNNNDFMAKIVNILVLDKEDNETAEYRIDLLDTISANKALYKNDALMERAPRILSFACDKNHYEVIKKILSDKKFYNDEHFINKIIYSLGLADSEKYLLYLMTDDWLTAGQIPLLYNCDTKFDEDKVQKTRTLNKIIGLDTAQASYPEDTLFLLDYLPFTDKSLIDELSKEEQRFILDEFMKAGAELFEISDSLREHFPLIPKNKDEYCSTVSKLANSLKQGINFDDKTLETINGNLFNIINQPSLMNNQEFNNLSDSDKKVVLLSAIFYNLSSDFTDNCHNLKQLGLTDNEQIKLFTLLQNKDWIEELSSAVLYDEIEFIAYKFRFDNTFDLACILYDDKIQELKNNRSVISIRLQKIKKDIKELKESQPILPVTKFPKASRINEAITEVNKDGSTNLKGIYRDSDGLIVINYNEVENSTWEKIGFKRGTISKGIKTKGFEEDINTGNIKFFVHGLDNAIQLVNFEAFDMPDSNALLSVSYAERPESKYRFFRPQGVILDVDTENIHTGENSDAGTGYKKTLEKFFPAILGNRHYHPFILNSKDIFKEGNYPIFVSENRNKQFSDIYPVELRNKLINLFAISDSKTRAGAREYNEFLITNPKPPMAVYAYSYDKDEKIDNPLNFLNRDFKTEKEEKNTFCFDSIFNRTKFLRKYALSHNIPFVVFGE